MSLGKNGTAVANEFVEAGAINQFDGADTVTFKPTTGTNSTLAGWGKWWVPEGAVAGDTFRIRFVITYSGFDTSNTSGTFNIRFQGSNYTSPTTAVWAGTNPICPILNNTQSLTTLVLSQASGTFVYETTFSLTQAFLDSYIGGNLSIRSDYSNGTGSLTISSTKIIPEKYSITDNIKMRITNTHISTNEFIEY